MFKIKDGIDLKELEKFGYKRIEDFINRLPPQYIYVKKYENDVRIEIEEETKEIWKMCTIYWSTPEEKDIQDLIQAGLVEKVSDE